MQLPSTPMLLAGLALLTASCHFVGPRQLDVRTSSAMNAAPVGVAIEVNWKQRLDQPYVFLELVGDYDSTRRQLGLLAQYAHAQGFAPSGPPFALFYDDPSRVSVDERRSRICLPIATTAQAASPLGFDVLSAEPVVYGFVRGAYRDLEGAYGGMFEYLGERSWMLTGPIREIYLVDPSTVQGSEELIAELQMPWRPL